MQFMEAEGLARKIRMCPWGKQKHYVSIFINLGQFRSVQIEAVGTSFLLL